MSVNNKRKKLSWFIRFVFLTFTVLSVYLPYYFYFILLLCLLGEFGYIVHTYFNYLNDLFDIDYEETYSQRQIVSFHFYLTSMVVIIGGLLMYYIETDHLICNVKFGKLIYYFIKFMLVFYVISNIHSHILINKLIGIENALPPLSRLIRKIINKIKYNY